MLISHGVPLVGVKEGRDGKNNVSSS